MLVAGIDVGGERKGFHIAVLDCGSGQIISLSNSNSPSQVAGHLATLQTLECIAIDCPPRCQIRGPETRLAERDLHKEGFRVQWTRRAPMPPPDWMVNGENLWRTLQNRLEQVQIIETFPTAVSRSLEDCAVVLPLALLKGDVLTRSGYKDFVDAALCAWTASRFLEGRASPIGVEDELGPIWV